MALEVLPGKQATLIMLKMADAGSLSAACYITPTAPAHCVHHRLEKGRQLAVSVV